MGSRSRRGSTVSALLCTAPAAPIPGPFVALALAPGSTVHLGGVR
jgi:hypothetical protein